MRLRLALVFIAVLVSGAARAQSCDECDDLSAWSAYNRIDLRMTSPQQKDTLTHWRVDFDVPRNDVRVDGETAEGGERRAGSVGVIAGRVIVSRGLQLDPGAELDAVDEPVATTQLLLALLARTVPAGPAGLKSEMKIDLREPKRGVEYATPSAGGRIVAPWSVTGSVRPQAGGAIAYDLHLVGNAQDPPSATHPLDVRFEGTLAERASPAFDDAMPLAGWRVTRLELNAAAPAKAAPPKGHGVESARTVGDARRMAEADAPPPPPLPSSTR
jgi:hypothetical protein